MPTQIDRSMEAENDETGGGDAPIPRASEDEVLKETARLVREGRKEREADPKEPKPASE
jgi:hypothetical protein